MDWEKGRPKVSSRRVVVSLVHGTWARNANWVKPGSSFRAALAAELQRVNVNVAFRVLKWSGGNSMRARRAAAQSLALMVRNECDGAPEFIIGHSHGGTVAMRACNDAETTRRISGVACLSTPVYHLRQRSDDERSWIMATLAPTVMGLLAAGFFSTVAIVGAVALVVAGSVLNWRAKKAGPLWATSAHPNNVFFRGAGDEATATLSLARLACWIIEHAASWWSVAIIAFSLCVAIATNAVLGRPTVRFLTKEVHEALYIIGVLIVPLALNSVLIGAIPALVFAGLGFGWDSAALIVGTQVSAEETPEGEWRVTQFSFMSAEGKVRRPFFAHSALWQHPDVARALAEWIATSIRPVERSGHEGVARRTLHDHRIPDSAIGELDESCK